ncbi:auxin-responsive protein IAA16-like isoform X1 [Ananas comosus]|uniref:Auxin-responsive protein n=2 Tax=Ananas comosus TaxID=4615 RepID=A0A6P5EYT8_ANACO|nr:auxin-responsive protein IAA16-like isoform X1 [Ananas comosus]
MEEGFKKGLDGCPQLLHLIQNQGDWMVSRGNSGGQSCVGAVEEKKLELRLGLPSGEEWSTVKERDREQAHSVESHGGHFSKVAKSNISNFCVGSNGGFLGSVELNSQGFWQQQGLLQLQAKAGVVEEPKEKTNGSGEKQQSLDKKGCGPPEAHAAASGNSAVANNNSSQTRTTTTPVVGWPPIRSFRKNIAYTSKPFPEPQNESSKIVTKIESKEKGLFVKINMDGIPIGRKVDLKAYDSYEKLSLAVDELFRGLLAAQKDPLAPGTQKSAEEKQAITGLLDGSGEYTLVYEDDEGDRLLVGDVPWNMFISTAKRLRVLKSSDLCASSLRTVSRKRTATDS